MRRFKSLACSGVLFACAFAAPSWAQGQSAAASPAPFSVVPASQGFMKPANPQAHALIMTIGDYPSPIPKLTGVQFDANSASEIAQRMGVPPENIQILKDGDLTLAGMRNAFDTLESSLSGDDQVFVYFSGHGGRKTVQVDGVDQCSESLITADGLGFNDTEMADRMKSLSKKAQKLIYFLDSCFSGGVTTRSIGGKTAAFTSKAWTEPGQSCTKPSNVLTRSIILSKAPGSGSANYVHIAAASDSEVSLDQPGMGGLATGAWLGCLQGAAQDTRGGGGLSATDIRNCAQAQINDKLKNVDGFTPPHVTLHGNSDMVLSYSAKSNTPTPTTTPTPAPTVQSVSATTPAAPSALAALNDIYNNRDDRRIVTLSAEKPSLLIGKDNLHFSLTSREGGYVYLLMVGSDGKTFDLLFPNQLDRNNQLPPGGSLDLPRGNWDLSADGPAGTDTLLALVTDSPRDFSSVGFQSVGPFSSASAVAAKSIQLVTAGAAQPALASRECANSGLRNITIRKKCSSGYAAALLSIEEQAP